MNYKKFITASLVIVSVFLLFQCKKDKPLQEDSRLPYLKTLDPKTQISELCRNLIIKGLNKEGSFPLSNSNTLQIVIAQQSASITNDNILFVPFVFKASNPVSGIYMQISGADNYWNINAPPTNDDVYVIKVGIPPRVLNGSFDLLYKLYDQSGNIGNQGKMNVSVVSAQSFCDNQNPIPRVEGRDGLTVRTFNMGDKPGKVKIAYNTYTVKDRIDIRSLALRC